MLEASPTSSEAALAELQGLLAEALDKAEMWDRAAARKSIGRYGIKVCRDCRDPLNGTRRRERCAPCQAKVSEAKRRQWAIDNADRKRECERRRVNERYATDPEYRAKRIAASAQRRAAS